MHALKREISSEKKTSDVLRNSHVSDKKFKVNNKIERCVTFMLQYLSVRRDDSIESNFCFISCVFELAFKVREY